MSRFWNVVRELEWFAVIALVFLVTASVLALLIALEVLPFVFSVLALVLTGAAIVSGLFSFRS